MKPEDFTVLIADDSWVIRQYLTKMLSGRGFNVIDAVNGKDALDKIEQKKPDCLLLDLLMPEMNGIDVLEGMKSKGISMPTIVITADIQDTTRNRCEELGTFAFINKPPDENKLMKILQVALHLE